MFYYEFGFLISISSEQKRASSSKGTSFRSKGDPLFDRVLYVFFDGLLVVVTALSGGVRTEDTPLLVRVDSLDLKIQ